LTIRILGSGTSHGVPVIGCHCAVCTSSDPRDSRFRASVLIRSSKGASILIDAGPEFRLQAIQAGLDRLSALLLTHSHADHLHGLDDLRALTHERALPVYAQRRVNAELRQRFPYIFQGQSEGGGVPALELRDIEPGSRFAIDGQEILPIPIKHGSQDILGFRVGGFGYLTDCSAIPEASLPLLSGLECLVIDGLRNRPHPTHFSIKEAVIAAGRIAPRKAYLTHLCHEVSHVQAEGLCRVFAREAGLREDLVEPAYDGLEIEVKPETR
jgi:phosphoribosyl 1,2-cyclic phosphate phosphodiesterase